ncbi:MAG: Uma2 family endonuclease [Gemmatimonadaceae bacterium]|nr:Uma2 family endonuclease [Gemmatimonadaceae bacterium]
MAMAISVPLYTVDDLDGFPRDGNRYELLDGVLLVTPAPSMSHQLVASRLQLRLSNAVMLPGMANVVGPGAVVLLPKTQLEPDILVFPAGIRASAHWREVHEHWLAVEILSPSSRVYDREFKRDAYLALGVRQVWLVDLPDRSVEVCRGAGDSETVRDVVRWRVPGIDTLVSIGLEEIFAGL